MELTGGQQLMVSITGDAATAWARTMLKSLKSYEPADQQAVICLSLARAIKSIAGDSEIVVDAVVEALRG